MEFGKFSTTYSHPMDRAYGESKPGDNSTNDVGVGVKDIGMSLGLGPVPNVQAVQAKIRTGAKSFELGFMGTGKGQGQQHTPEYYGKLQRQALEEMSRASEIDFTTHATVGVMGLAGMDQQGNFSKANQKFAVDEIKRAVEFAADVARGGNIVVHTGEFQRPLSEADWNQEGEFAGKFQSYKEEPEMATFKVIDNRTGQALVEARKNRPVARPVWNRYEEGNEYFKEQDGKSYRDQKGELVKSGDYLDYMGNKIDAKDRLPKFNKETKSFDTQLMTWKAMEKEAEEMTERAKADWRKWKSGRMTGEEIKESIWSRFLKEGINENQINVKPEEAYVISSMETSASQAKGFAHYYGGDFDEHVHNLKRLRKAREFYEKLEKETDPEEKWRLQKQTAEFGDLVPPETKFPTQVLDKYINQTKRQMSYAQEGAASQWAQAREQMENIKHVESAETYAFDQGCEAYAEAGLKAMEESNKLEKQGKLKDPLFIGMENLFPESYGAHPDELINLVESSRMQMTEMLKQKGYSESQAKQEARDHIKATFDTGHLNMWRKYWKGDPKNTPEQNDQQFNKWFLTKVEQMAEKGIVGNVHLVDNYGYQDDHLAPGQGNTPVKEAVKILKKHGYKGPLTVEPGADWSTDVSGFHSVMKTWQLFGSPVYGHGVGGPPAQKRWGDIQYSYFGQTQPPYFTFGGYSPSEDWTLWSGVGME